MHGTRRILAKVMIEADDAMHIGTGKIQDLRDQRHCIPRDASERSLDIVENGQQRSLTISMPRGNFHDASFLRAGQSGLLRTHWMRVICHGIPPYTIGEPVKSGSDVWKPSTTLKFQPL
jgi:hypothetical protein